MTEARLNYVEAEKEDYIGSYNWERQGGASGMARSLYSMFLGIYFSPALSFHFLSVGFIHQLSPKGPLGSSKLRAYGKKMPSTICQHKSWSGHIGLCWVPWWSLAQSLTLISRSGVTHPPTKPSSDTAQRAMWMSRVELLPSGKGGAVIGRR